jgi:hypothetical protein
MGYGRSSPPGTCVTNEIKTITGLGKTGEGRLTLVFALHVLLDHQPVHKFLDDKQLRMPTDTASICPAGTSQREALWKGQKGHIYLAQVASTVVSLQTKT